MPLPRACIVHLAPETISALADGDLDAANATSPVPLTEPFVSETFRAVWRMRARQVVDDPASAEWVTGVIWDEDAEVAVGRAGFHGPPDTDGMVEIGYEVDPSYRRRGFARAALTALIARADADPTVAVVRVTIAPDNTPSRDLALPFGFVHVGEQWDKEDGLELVYERPARPQA
ncbi:MULTISPECIES: GNAT family N-acetyltransferase [Mumia]|uniref:GNAT family N-acetyltransferase n=1 Tax=Mumia TaxID=1546255 RepID=UPI001422F4DB|nr:GNAT family protein [Mumia sp. ZJ430]